MINVEWLDETVRQNGETNRLDETVEGPCARFSLANSRTSIDWNLSYYRPV